MEILNLPNTTSIQVAVDVPTASETYSLSYTDIDTGITYSASAVSSASSVVTFTLDSRYLMYNGSLDAQVFNNQSSQVYATGIDIVKPYCNISYVAEALNLTNTAVIQSEKIARKIINSQAGKFGLVHKQKEIVGMGLDYLPVNENIQKLYYIWENGVLIYDYEDENLDDFKISIDKTSIVPSTTEENKMNYKYVWRDRYLNSSFADGYEYIIEADFGYKFVPEDIVEACELLVQDIASDSIRYSNKYIQQFDNREFNITFAKNQSNGTGNQIVDKILEEYKNKIVPGVL